MSNIKQIDAHVVVPFDFMEKASEPDAARLGRLLLTPTNGLTHHFEFCGHDQNHSTGGRTAMYSLKITGEEALSYGYLAELLTMFQRVGEVIDVRAKDIIGLQGETAFTW